MNRTVSMEDTFHMKQLKLVNSSRSFSPESESFLEDAMSFIRAALLRLGITKKLVARSELLAEESIVAMKQHAGAGAALRVQVRKFFGDASITLSMLGEEFDPGSKSVTSQDLPEQDEEAEEAIRSILIRSYGEKYKYNHKNHMNRIRILTGQAEQSMLVSTMIALALGLVFGLIAKFVLPQSISNGLAEYLFNPIKTMFMNGLRIVIAPVVFFSIVSCISQFNSILELGRLGAKVMGIYMLTTVIAVILGLGVTRLIQPGEWGFALTAGMQTPSVHIDTNVDTSILSTIVNIVPSNFLAPFVNADTLQIMFLAVLCGIAVGMIGEYSKLIRDLFDAFNSFFLTITAMIARFIPVAVFCSVVLLVMEAGGSSLLAVLGVGGTHILLLCCMLAVYALLILLFTHLSPVTFFRKNREGMLTSFTLSSSSAALPTNMRICTEKMGIAPKISNFSIPLGATINMDGTCIYLCVLGLFLARAYGVNVPLSSMLSVALTIILLSLGAPGVPGAGLVCLSVVLNALNVPTEAIGLVIAINPVLEMFTTASNTTGDVAAALIVAKSENQLDVEKFNSP